MHASRVQDYSDSSSGSYRVTVRQLEAMVRLGEARARVDLSEFISEAHIKEARRLLKESIMHVSHDDVDVVQQERQPPLTRRPSPLVCWRCLPRAQ